MEKIITAFLVFFTVSTLFLGIAILQDLNDGRVIRAVASIVQVGNVAQAKELK